MFKRFLKFFRGDEQAPEEPFEGSYLDHLLDKVRPSAEAHLEDCPEHDPLLLIVTGILRETLLNAWSPLLRQPLWDTQSPGSRPKGVSPDTTAEMPVVKGPPPSSVENGDDIEVIDEEDFFVTPSAGASKAEETDAKPPPEDEEIPAGPSVASTASMRITEEMDIAEIRALSMRRTNDETLERDVVVPEADPTIEIDQAALIEQQHAADRPRLDTEEVLQAGRVFLGLLIENDRLPLELQLSVAETALARDLLLGYFIGHDDFEDKARRLLTMVEQKFGEGLFSQARILLQLFHTDEQTRVNNDRNLFYEDMILRLGIRRRHKLSAEEVERFRELVAGAETPQGVEALTTWLASTCLIKFQLFSRDPIEVESWKAFCNKTTRAGGAETFLRYLPPRRWRPVGSYVDVDALEHLRSHVNAETARSYVVGQLKTCYFVLRAVGDTGLEGYLDSFFDWCSEFFEVDGTVFMPELYKRSMMDPDPMEDILDDLYTRFFEEATSRKIGELEDAEIDAALFKAVKALQGCDLGEIAPGFYDLGAFVFDQIFGMTFPTPDFPFKIHRLT